MGTYVTNGEWDLLGRLVTQIQGKPKTSKDFYIQKILCINIFGGFVGNHTFCFASEPFHKDSWKYFLLPSHICILNNFMKRDFFCIYWLLQVCIWFLCKVPTSLDQWTQLNQKTEKAGNEYIFIVMDWFKNFNLKFWIKFQWIVFISQCWIHLAR